ncbi:MAG: hypothetical protein RJA81_2117, partial [Planctomycetota bacterium]
MVQEFRLDNGLTLLILPKTGTGTVLCDIYYGGGSACDPVGRYGLTHFLEHMLYNGTKRVPHGLLDRMILKSAGQHNAETGPDYTHFWCQLPRQGLELALMLEADRMTGALLDHDDIQRERPVILEEEARYRELPFDELMNRLMGIVYQNHPYSHPTIGTPQDIQSITQYDLKQHYQAMFRPENAVLVISGDVTAHRCTKLVEKHFGGIVSTASTLNWQDLPAPGHSAFRGLTVTIDADETVPRGVLLWPAPGPFDMTSRAWGVAAALLGGGRASRLWQVLVEETETAAFVGVSLSEERLGGYLMIELELNPDASPEKAEELVRKTIRELGESGPSEEEFARVARQRSSTARWARQQAVTLTNSLGTWALFSDWRALSEAWQQDERVTPQQIRDVARELGPDNWITGWTLPQENSAAENSKEISQKVSTDQAVPKSPSSLPEMAQLDQTLISVVERASNRPSRFRPKTRPILRKTPEGMILLAESLRNEGVFAAELRWKTGWLEEQMPGVAYLSARMNEETLSSQAGLTLGEWFESQGAGLESSSSGFSIQGRMEDTETLLDNLVKLISPCQWPEDAFEKVIRRTATELEADLDDPGYQAELALKRLVYAGGPGSEDPRGTGQSLSKITPEMLRMYQKKYFQPANAILGLTSDLQSRTALSLWTNR